MPMCNNQWGNLCGPYATNQGCPWPFEDANGGGCTGCTGATGPMGPTGPAGAAELAAYGVFVSNTERVLMPGVPIPFDMAVGPNKNIAFTPDMTGVTVDMDGIYLIDYRIVHIAGAGALFRLLVNGTPLPGSEVSIMYVSGEFSGVVTVALSAGDTVGLDVDLAAITLSPDTNIFLSLQRIAS